LYYQYKTTNLPLTDRFDDESILPIGHLGIVAGTFNLLGITYEDSE